PWDDHVLGPRAVEREAHDERRDAAAGRIAPHAVRALAAGLSRGHDDTRARRPVLRDALAHQLDDTRGLVAGRDALQRRRERPVDQVDVGQADTARLHAHADLPRTRLGI